METGTPPEKVTVTSVSETMVPASLMTSLKRDLAYHPLKAENPEPMNWRVVASTTVTDVNCGELAMRASIVHSSGTKLLEQSKLFPSTTN